MYRRTVRFVPSSTPSRSATSRLAGTPPTSVTTEERVWHLELVRGVLLTRFVLPDGRRSWPWPITPLPIRPPRPDAAHRLAAALGWDRVTELTERERRELDDELEAAQADVRRRYGRPAVGEAMNEPGWSKEPCEFTGAHYTGPLVLRRREAPATHSADPLSQ